MGGGFYTARIAANWLRRLPRTGHLQVEALGTIAAEIRDLRPEAVKDVLDDLARTGRISDEGLVVLRALHAAAEEMAEIGRAGRVPVSAILSSDGHSFRFKQIARKYEQWVELQPLDADVSPQKFLEYHEKLNLSGATHAERKVAAILKGILGEPFDYKTQLTRRQRYDRFPSFSKIRRPVGTLSRPGQLGQKLADTYRSTQDVSSGVASSLSHLRQKISDPANGLEHLTEALEYFEAQTAAGGSGALPRLVEDLLVRQAGGKPLGTIDGADLRGLTGGRRASPQQVMDDLVLSHLLLRHELDRLHQYRRVRDGVEELSTPPAQLYDHFLSLNGADGFFTSVVRRAEHEHSLAYEQLIALNALDTLLRELGGDIGKVRNVLFIQTHLGAKGPDLLIVMELADGTRIATIVQAKSYLSLSGLLRKMPMEKLDDLTGNAITTALRGGWSECKGDIVRQIGSDATRLLEEGGRITDASRTAIAQIDGYDGLFRSKINWQRLIEDNFPMDDKALQAWAQKSDLVDISNVPDELIDPATGRSVAEMTRSEILASTDETIQSYLRNVNEMSTRQLIESRDPAVLDQVRSEFIRQYLDPLRRAANEDLALVGPELALEVKAMSRSGFTARFKEPVRGPLRESYRTVLDAFDDGNDTLVHDRFLGYFGAMFRGQEGLIQVEFDVNDALVGTKVLGAVINRTDRTIPTTPGPPIDVDFQ